jgi:hypothetical protein
MLPNITNMIPISSGKRLSITTASTIPAAIIKAVFMLPPFKKCSSSILLNHSMIMIHKIGLIRYRIPPQPTPE